jgi:hypothetical protein
VILLPKAMNLTDIISVSVALSLLLCHFTEFQLKTPVREVFKPASKAWKLLLAVGILLIVAVWIEVFLVFVNPGRRMDKFLGLKVIDWAGVVFAVYLLSRCYYLFQRKGE